MRFPKFLLRISAFGLVAFLSSCGSGVHTNANALVQSEEILYDAPYGGLLNTGGVFVLNSDSTALQSSEGFVAPYGFASGVASAQGKFFYVAANTSSGPYISAFAITDKDGTLSELPGSPYLVPGCNELHGLIVANQDTALLAATDQGISGFVINGTTGVATSSQSLSVARGFVYSVTTSPSSGAIYTVSDPGRSVISAFAINAAGLRELSGSPLTIKAVASAHANGQAVVVSNYLYVAMTGADTIGMVALSSADGSITGQNLLTVTGAGSLTSLSSLPGQLYGLDGNSGKLYGFSVASATGALIPVGGTPLSTGQGGLQSDNDHVAYVIGINGIQGYSIDPATNTLKSGLFLPNIGPSLLGFAKYQYS